jgi:hypothetical protein
MTVGEDSDDVPVAVVLIGGSLCRIGGEAAATSPKIHLFNCNFRKQCKPIDTSKNKEKLCYMFQLSIINVSVDI